MKKVFLVFAVAAALFTGSGYASNITISDENYTSAVWYMNQEDQEVEPGMAHGQVWDLEGFFLDGTQLSMVGGYDFRDGQSGMMSGDIFIDVTGDAVYGDIHGASNGNRSALNSYGYDYVIDLDWLTLTYDVFSIDGTAKITTSFYKQNQGSNPWRYESGGGLISEDAGFLYHAGVTGFDSILTGDWHNQLIVDIGFLQGRGYESFTSHYTMQCGNDNLMGSAPIPNPEPGTMLLLGFGLLGIAGIGRKKLKKS